MQKLIGYKEAERAAELALASKEHMMILGGPGQAKSQFVRAVLRSLQGAKAWEVQLTKSSDESHVFGIPNIEKLMKGEIEYAEHIPSLEADVWFIDEFFDGPDVVLRALLSPMNERRFIRASVPRGIPLHTAFATANYSRFNELTAAIVDRFVITVNAPELGATARKALYTGEEFEEKPFPDRPLKWYAEVYEKSKKVTISTGLVDALTDITSRFKFSPRREVKLAKLLRVQAALLNKVAVDSDCFEPLKWCLPIQEKEGERNKALSDFRKVSEHVASEFKFDAAITELEGKMGTLPRAQYQSKLNILRTSAPTPESAQKVAELYRKFQSVYKGSVK